MFEGFSPETVDFLWGIRMNNNRDWFTAHKSDYTTYLYEPMKELGKALYEPFSDETGTVMKVSRIYRDARLHYPVPYKESLWVCIRKDTQWWAENPCRFFEITPEGIRYGLVFWHPKAEKMEQFRKTIYAEPRAFRRLLADTERATGIPVTADLYKRPKPCDNPELAEYFRWKGRICCIRNVEFGPEAFSPDLALRARDFLVKVTPLCRYLEQFGG